MSQRTFDAIPDTALADIPPVSAGVPAIQGTLSYEDQDQRIVAALRAVARAAARQIRILEAGCGLRWPFDLSDIDYRLTGVDLDAAALKIRQSVNHDLDEVIHGDLCTIGLPDQAFDVVYSAYVLEHIPDATLALDNMLRTLRPGGLLVLRIPDPDTARGLVTRSTPFWFHVFYHRHVMKRPAAGMPGHAPYPTYYHPVISREGIRTYLAKNHLTCTAVYADTFVRDGEGMAGLVFRAGAKLISLATLGRFTSRYNDLVYLIAKP